MEKHSRRTPETKHVLRSLEESCLPQAQPPQHLPNARSPQAALTELRRDGGERTPKSASRTREGCACGDFVRKRSQVTAGHGGKAAPLGLRGRSGVGIRSRAREPARRASYLPAVIRGPRRGSFPGIRG